MRKLALLATLVIAALAMTATTALATTEVRDATTEELCSDVSPAINKQNPPVLYGGFSAPYQGSLPAPYESGGCTVNVASVDAMAMSNPGYVGECDISYDIHIGPDGWGYATDFQFSHHPSACPSNWSTTSASRIVMPGDVNPTAPFFPSGWYTAADAETDFNVEMYARWTPNGSGTYSERFGFVSLNVDDPDVYEHNAIENQLLDNQFWGSGGVFEGGSWVTSPNDPESSAGLIITHE